MTSVGVSPWSDLPLGGRVEVSPWSDLPLNRILYVPLHLAIAVHNVHGGGFVEERDRGPSCSEHFVFYPRDREG